MATRRSLSTLIGLAGVAPDENRRARQCGKWFEVPMLLIAIWIVVEWYLHAHGRYPRQWGIITNWVVWIFFVGETLLLTLLVRDKARYLRSNWINLLIIAVGVPLLWSDQPYAGALRSLRLILLFGMILEMSTTVRLMLSRNNLGITLLVALIIVAMAGTAIAAIDPAIDTPWDGIWWAWVTVTTVGYGDIVPSSPQGKIFGGVLMALGLGLFSLITASFSAFLIEREEEELIEKEETLIEKEEEISAAEQRTAAHLSTIERRLERLEAHLERLVEALPESDSGDDPESAVSDESDSGGPGRRR